MENCSCAWQSDSVLRSGDEVIWRTPFVQTHWCRAHMEAEIAKQGQAAGPAAKGATDNVDGAQKGIADAKRGIQ